MMAYLDGGPANGRVIMHPRLHLFRVPIPRPIELTSPEEALNAAMNPDINMDVADYQFTGQASVDMDGKVKYVIYRFTGME